MKDRRTRSQSLQSFRDATIFVMVLLAALSVKVDWNPIREVIAPGAVHAAIPTPSSSSSIAEPVRPEVEATPAVSCPKARFEVEATDTVDVRCGGERSVHRVIPVDAAPSSLAVVRITSHRAS